jgi:hypothetical protein
MCPDYTPVHTSTRPAHTLQAALNNFDPDNTWVGMQDLDTSDNITRYIAAVYWAFTTMWWVGFRWQVYHLASPQLLPISLHLPLP